MWISFPKFYKIVFAGFFPVLVAIGIGSYFMSNRFADDEELVIHTYKVISMLETVSSELGEAESARHGYVVLGDESQLREYQAAVQDVPQVLQQLQSLTADNPRQQQQLAQLSPLVRTRLELSRQAMAPQSHDLSPAGPQAELSPQGAVLDAQIRAQLNAMEDEENQLLRERARLSARNQRRSTAFLLLAFLIASIMLVFLFMVMSWEVKRRTEAEVLAKENEERFRLLVSGVQDFAILRLDLDGRISTWNLGAERLFGYQASEILGQPLSHLFRTCDKATPEAHLRTALTVGYVQDECQQLRKDGTVFWSTAHLTLLRNEAGQPHGYALITRDITERREASGTDQPARGPTQRVLLERFGRPCHHRPGPAFSTDQWTLLGPERAPARREHGPVLCGMSCRILRPRSSRSFATSWTQARRCSIMKSRDTHPPRPG